MSEFDQPEQLEPFQPPEEALPREELPPLDIIRNGGRYGIFVAPESPLPLYGLPIVSSDSRRGCGQDGPEDESVGKPPIPVIPGEGDDGPYEEQCMVTHPVTEELVPGAELLDELHLVVRTQELVQHAEHPLPEPVPIPTHEIGGQAAMLIGKLQGAVDATPWAEVEEGVNWDGRTIRTYAVSVPSRAESEEGRSTHVRLQLGFDTPDSPTPSCGNLSIMLPSPGGYPQEYSLNVDLAEQGGPLIRYDNYPFHEEGLGRPQRNTQFGLEQAHRLVASIPKFA